MSRDHYISPNDLTPDTDCDGKFIGRIGSRKIFFMKIVSVGQKRIQSSHNINIKKKPTLWYILVDNNGNYGLIHSNEDLGNIDDCIEFVATIKARFVDYKLNQRVTHFKRIRIIDNVGSVSDPK